MKLIIYLILLGNFCYAQNANDKLIETLVNDSIFINRTHYKDCESIDVANENAYFTVNEITNYKKQLFKISNHITAADLDPKRFSKEEIKDGNYELRNNRNSCGVLFIKEIITQGRNATLIYYCPQKNLRGKIKFRIKKGIPVIIAREMGTL
jgi:hypothetical protein